MDNIQKEYLNFIKENTKFIQHNEKNITEIVTPYVNSYGEGIYFNVNYDGNKYTITDNGFTLWNLELEGIKLTVKGNRKELLKSLLNFNGFSLNNKKEIIKTVDKVDLGQSIHDMTQLLLNIYDFSMLSPQMVQNQFLEDVKNYFMSDEKKYTVFPNLSITGKSKINHRFHYLFMSDGKSKLTRVHNNIDKQQVDSILAGWLDTIEFRKKEYGNKEELYIVVSDEGYNKINDKNLTALKEYDIEVLNFSDKKQLEKSLGNK